MNSRLSAGKAKPKPKPKPKAATGPQDWRGLTLARMRALIFEADPEMVEERKWKKPSNPAGVPVWSHHGLVCTGETYAVEARAFKALVKAAVAQNAVVKAK